MTRKELIVRRYIHALRSFGLAPRELSPWHFRLAIDESKAVDIWPSTSKFALIDLARSPGPRGGFISRVQVGGPREAMRFWARHKDSVFDPWEGVRKTLGRGL